MTADELWEKYAIDELMDREYFLSALAERDAYVKNECVRVCEELPLTECVRNPDVDDLAEEVIHMNCAAAIERMEIK